MNPEQNQQSANNEDNQTDNNLFEKAKQRMSQFKRVSIIGLCDKGDVLVVNDSNLHQNKTVKRIHKSFIQDEQKANELCKQLNYQRQLNHPFILPIQDILQDEKQIYVLSDFCPCGDLYGYLQSNGQFNEENVKFIAVQLIEAIRYLHKNHCIHCNIVAENVLVGKNGYVQLTGFSNSLINQSLPYYALNGFLECLSPDLLLNKGIDESYDWYQLGCLIYELIEGRLPFSGSTTTTTLQMILLGKIEYNQTSKEAQYLIQDLLTPEKAKQFDGNIKNIMKYDWFKGVSWKNVQNKILPSPIIRISNPDDPTCYYPYYKEDIVDQDANPNYFNSIFTLQLLPNK